MPVKFLNMNPTTYVKGGLMDDVDVEVIGSVFEWFDYGGVATSVPALKLTLKDMDSGNEEEVHYSVGAAKDFEPSEDGEYIVPVGSSSFFRSGSNYAFFMGQLVLAGCPAEKLDNAPVSILVGLKAHMIRKEAPARDNLQNQQQEGDRKKTILVPSKIIQLPWEGKGKQTAAAQKKTAPAAGAGPAAKATAAAATIAPEDLPEEVQLAIHGLITSLIEASENNQASKTTLGLKAVTALKVPSAIKSAAVKAAKDDAFLASLGFMVDGDVIVMAE